MPEQIEIRFHVTQEKIQRLTLDQVIALEGMDNFERQGAWMAQVLGAMAVFMVDAKQMPLPLKEARRRVGSLRMDEIQGVAGALGKAIEDFLSPGTNGSPSLPGSTTAGGSPPDGSESSSP